MSMRHAVGFLSCVGVTVTVVLSICLAPQQLYDGLRAPLDQDFASKKLSVRQGTANCIIVLLSFPLQFVAQ